jgi:DNA-binding XRE family transcriptional regulator
MRTAKAVNTKPRPCYLFPATSPDQCREVRAILKWTRQELADAAGVTPWVVAAFEDGREVLAFYEIEIRAALEAVGIGFPFDSSSTVGALMRVISR